MEERGVNEGLKERLMEIYEKTKSVVKVGRKMGRKF